MGSGSVGETVKIVFGVIVGALLFGGSPATARPTYDQAATVCQNLTGQTFDNCVDTMADLVAKSILEPPKQS